MKGIFAKTTNPICNKPLSTVANPVSNSATPQRLDSVINLHDDEPPIGADGPPVVVVVVPPPTIAIAIASVGTVSSSSAVSSVGVVVVTTPVTAPVPPCRSSSSSCRRRTRSSGSTLDGTTLCSIRGLLRGSHSRRRPDEGFHGRDVLLGLGAARVLVGLDGGREVLLVLRDLG